MHNSEANQIKKQLHASVPSGISITITKTSAITETKTPLINNKYF